MNQDKIFKLKGTIQHYAWGGADYIPHWLSIENKDHKPFAEYWLGAHASASSTLIFNGKEQPLSTLIKDEPILFLGEETQRAFGGLPYLFKILDVKDMLSIQVHPTKSEAKKGYDAEEANGVAINAPHRNYKDENHKPEVMVALSDFWLLHGFLETDKLMKVLTDVPEFDVLTEVFDSKGYKGLYEYVMTMSQPDVDALLMPLVERELESKKKNALSKEEPGWWVAKLYENGGAAGNIDRGIFSIYFFNIVYAQPGDGVFQGAGMPHAYLEGQNVELMANSDNVLRGGLTPKHVDVPELIQHIAFEATVPNIMKGSVEANNEVRYDCPVKDFGISKIDIKQDETVAAASKSLEIMMVMEGEITVEGSNSINAKKGEAIAVLPGENYTISTQNTALVYKAFVP